MQISAGLDIRSVLPPVLRDRLRQRTERTLRCRTTNSEAPSERAREAFGNRPVSDAHSEL